MKTITFYSYKGGVGRSLALSNIAKRLSEYNKKVCVLDFDLEAPGLQFKFNGYSRPVIQKGIVDYIHNFCNHSSHTEKINDYAITLKPANQIFEPIKFIASGNINNNEYWKKLSEINWFEMFYSENAQGVKFFLDLKAKIQKEIEPDVLLIDSRTGITDISGVTLRLLADEVIVFAANNEENMFGSQKIIQSLLDTSKALFNKVPKINFVLTRIPFTDKPGDKEKEFKLIQNRKNELKKNIGLNDLEISVIHSDRRLEEKESLLIGYEYQEKTASIENDYLVLFDKISSEILNDVEKIKFKNTKIAEKEFLKSLNEEDIPKKIQFLNQAIELDPTKYSYFWDRGHAYSILGEWKKTQIDYDKALELNPKDASLLFNRGIASFNINEFEKSIEFYEKALEIDSNMPHAYQNIAVTLTKLEKRELALETLNNAIDNKNLITGNLYNSRADLLRYFGKLEEASKDVFKAISLDPNNPIFFGTLAEIYLSKGKEEEFYLNLTVALSKGITSRELRSAKDIYFKIRNEERFINLMNMYRVDPDEIFKEG